MPDSLSQFQFSQFFTAVKRDLSQNLSTLLVFDIFFKVVAATVFGPLSVWVINRLVATSGAYVVGNEQIVSFLFSPVGMTVVILAGGMTLAIIFAEQSGIILIVSRAKVGVHMRAHDAIAEMLKSLRAIFELGMRQTIFGLLYLAPLAVIGATTLYLFSSRYDVNFLWVEKPPIFWLGTGIIGFLAICGSLVICVLYVGWIFAVPLCVIENNRPSTALRNSRKLVAGYFGKIAVLLLGWALLIAASGAVVAFVMDVLSEFILNRVGENQTLIIPTVCLLLGLYGLTAAALAFIGFASNCLLIFQLYHHICGVNAFSETAAPRSGQDSPRPRPSGRKTVWLIVILTMTVTTGSALFFLSRIELERQVYITAHRGSSAHAPENSLSAIRQAIDDEADFAEIDVQETADGVIVLLHDTDLKRIAGVHKKIWQLTYSEIKSLDAGSWFSAKFKGERIPTLAEAMKLSRNKIKLNIELKFNGHEKHLVESVVKLIADHDFARQCIITSLNQDGLKKVASINPELKTGFIIAKSIGAMFRIDADILSLSSAMVNADVVAAARKRKKQLHVWTVNSPESMLRFINLGVDNIITDYPANLVNLVKKRATLSDVEKLLLVAGDLLRQ